MSSLPSGRFSTTDAEDKPALASHPAFAAQVYTDCSQERLQTRGPGVSRVLGVVSRTPDPMVEARVARIDSRPCWGCPETRAHSRAQTGARDATNG